MAPSTYYANKTRTPSARACRDAAVGPALRALWEDNYRVYGARKLWKAARRAGHEIGRDQVARHMRAAGISGARRGKRVCTTRPDPTAPRHPDLVGRDFTASAKTAVEVEAGAAPLNADLPARARTDGRTVRRIPSRVVLQLNSRARPTTPRRR